MECEITLIFLEMTIVATPLSIKLVSERASDINLSTPRVKALTKVFGMILNIKLIRSNEAVLFILRFSARAHVIESSFQLNYLKYHSYDFLK